MAQALFKSFDQVATAAKAEALLEDQPAGAVLTLALAEDPDLAEYRDGLTDLRGLFDGTAWFSPASLNTLRCKDVSAALLAALPLFSNLRLGGFPARALNMTALRDAAGSPPKLLCKLLGIACESEDEGTIAALLGAIYGAPGAYRSMSASGYQARVDAGAVTLVKREASDWHPVPASPVSLPKGAHLVLSKDLATIVGEATAESLLMNVVSNEARATPPSRSTSAGSARSDRQSLGGSRGRSLSATRGIAQSPPQATDVASDFAAKLDATVVTASAETLNEVSLGDSELDDYRFVVLGVGPDKTMADVLTALLGAMGVAEALYNLPDLAEHKVSDMSGMLLALCRQKALISLAGKDSAIDYDAVLPDGLFEAANEGLYLLGASLVRVEDMAGGLALSPCESWATARNDETKAKSWVVDELWATFLPGFTAFAEYQYETGWARTVFQTIDSPQSVGTFANLYQTTAVKAEAKILAWNSLVPKNSQVSAQPFDMTWAQNMDLSVSLMASAGDSNRHLGSAGQATYYDVSVIMVGVQYPTVRFLALLLPWTKAGGEGANSAGGETLAVAIPSGSYMGQLMTALTAMGTNTSGGGFTTSTRYVSGNMSCSSKGPYVFSGQDLDGASVSPAALRANAKALGENVCLVECVGVVNPQYVHPAGAAVVNRAFDPAQCQYRVKCKSMAMIGIAGSHADLATPTTQTGTVSRSGLRPQGSSGAKAKTVSGRRNRNRAT